MNYSHRAITAEIRTAVISFLDRCDIPFPSVELDREFDAACRADAARRGFPIDIAPCIRYGVAMASHTYGHLNNKSTQMFICHYTSLLMYLDDSKDMEFVREFQSRFMQQKPQGDHILNCIAELLRELPLHFNTMVSNLILTSTLNAITGVLVEYDTHGMELHEDAHGYPAYSRFLTGSSEAFALMVFPPEIPFQKYIQALPELMTYLNYANDVLSFYKEEVAGESVNHVSLLARVHRVSKLEALSRVADDALDAHTRILGILKSHDMALEAYQKLAYGYVAFHAALPRYRLEELELQGSTRL